MYRLRKHTKTAEDMKMVSALRKTCKWRDLKRTYGCAQCRWALMVLIWSIISFAFSWFWDSGCSACALFLFSAYTVPACHLRSQSYNIMVSRKSRNITWCMWTKYQPRTAARPHLRQRQANWRPETFLERVSRGSCHQSRRYSNGLTTWAVFPFVDPKKLRSPTEAEVKTA